MEGPQIVVLSIHPQKKVLPVNTPNGCGTLSKWRSAGATVQPEREGQAPSPGLAGSGC